MPQDRLAHRHALITGGSSGIGLAVARRLAQRGMHCTLLARDAARLAAARAQVQAACAQPTQQVQVFAADVRAQAAVERAVVQATLAAGPPALVLAAAGVVVPGTCAALPLDAFAHTMAVNYTGTLHTVKATLPLLRRAGGGALVLVSSGAGLLGLYGYSAYSPSKFAVRGLAEALRGELRPAGITVSIVYPPDTDTPMLAAEQATRPAITAALAGGARVLPAETVAAAIVRGVERRAFVIAPGWEMALLARLHSLVSPLYNCYADRVAARLIQAERAGR